MKKLLLSLFVCFSVILSGMVISCDSPSNSQALLIAAANTPASDNPSEPEKKPEQKPSFTVSFETDGGTAVAAQTVTSGNKATRPANPTKTGCTFAGWYTSSTLTTVFDFDTAITANTVLYAKWDIAEGYYKVTFNANGGTLSTATWIAVQSGQTITAPAAPTKSFAIFEGWCTDSACTTPFTFTTPITANTELYAKWTPAGIINMGLEEITMSTTEVPGCYTFTVSPALHASYQQAIAQSNQSAQAGTQYSLEYQYIIVGQGFTHEGFDSTLRGGISTNSNRWACSETLINNVNYRLIVRVNSLETNTSNSNIQIRNRIDTLYYDFRG